MTAIVAVMVDDGRRRQPLPVTTDADGTLNSGSRDSVIRRMFPYKMRQMNDACTSLMIIYDDDDDHQEERSREISPWRTVLSPLPGDRQQENRDTERQERRGWG